MFLSSFVSIHLFVMFFCGCICQKIVKNGHCKFKEHKKACGSLNQQTVDIVCMCVYYNLITQI